MEEGDVERRSASGVVQRWFAERAVPVHGEYDEAVGIWRIQRASSPVLDSEVSGTIVSLRERFEAVRRGKIHRLRGRLGDLSPEAERQEK